MNYLNTFLLALALMLWGCAAPSENTLSEDAAFQAIFDQAEIDGLQQLFDFFNAHICTAGQQEGLTACYQVFLERLREEQKAGHLSIGIPLPSQQVLYERIPDEAFRAIWMETTAISQGRGETGRDTFSTVEINLQGKYMAFLKQIGERDERIQNYHNRIATLGSIGPSNIADLLINYDAYRIEDIRTKFIIAVHYLTLNDRLR